MLTAFALYKTPRDIAHISSDGQSLSHHSRSTKKQIKVAIAILADLGLLISQVIIAQYVPSVAEFWSQVGDFLFQPHPLAYSVCCVTLILLIKIGHLNYWAYHRIARNTAK